MDKFLNYMKNGDEEGEEEYMEDDGYIEPSEEKFEERKVERKAIQPKAKRSISPTDASVHVFKPKDTDEARDVIDALLNNETVLLNLENVDIQIAQRVLDMTTGACLAISGKLQKISNFIFIATPVSVDVSGEFQDTLGTM